MDYNLENHPDYRLIVLAIKNEPGFSLSDSVKNRIKTFIKKSDRQFQSNQK